MIGYLWSLPTTLVGLILGCGSLLGGGSCSVRGDRVLEVVGGLYARWMHRFGATTFGFVTLARNADIMNFIRPHERIHTRQAAWFGPFFLPVYGLSSLWARVRYGNWYWDNWMERQARLLSGVA